MRRRRLMFGALMKLFSPTPEPQQGSGPRSYMHGIGAVRAASGGDLVFFSSSGLPPKGADLTYHGVADPTHKWTHDIYVCRPGSAPAPFIQFPGAQEPVSVAQASDGNIMVTSEDSWHGAPNRMSQCYGVYDANLQPVAAYPQYVAICAHSGHVAAVGNYFVVFYSCGWFKGGVYASVFDSGGKLLRKIDVAPDARQWWPLVAGSPTRALLLWQKFIPARSHAALKMALLDPATGNVSGIKTVHPGVESYSYNAAYVAAIDRFLVVGSHSRRKGFACLVDNDGNTTAGPVQIPPTVREAGITVHGAAAYLPAADHTLTHLALTASSIAVAATQPAGAWSNLGSVGLMSGASEIRWLSLTRTGLQESVFRLGEASAYVRYGVWSAAWNRAKQIYRHSRLMPK